MDNTELLGNGKTETSMYYPNNCDTFEHRYDDAMPLFPISSFLFTTLTLYNMPNCVGDPDKTGNSGEINAVQDSGVFSR